VSRRPPRGTPPLHEKRGFDWNIGPVSRPVAPADPPLVREEKIMLKKVVAAAAVGAGLLMMGTPAFATQGGEVEEMTDLASKYDHTHQVGVVNMDDSELLSDINVCHVDVNVIAVPLFSNNDGGPCVNPDIEGDADR
jgi:hypothetical protein